MKRQLAKILIVLIAFLFAWVFVEFTASLIIYWKKSEDGKSELFLLKFPVQFRLPEKILEYTVNSRHAVTTEARDFYFDPVLNYQSKSYLVLHTESGDIRYENDSWWDQIAEHKNAHWVVTLGGSTTASAQLSNWPSHLISEFAKHQKHNLVVLNAGHNGYGLSQEYIYFLYYVLPNLTKRNIKIRTLISLDGVNEVSLGIAPVFEKKLKGQAYNPLYGGYSNIIERNYSGQFEGSNIDNLSRLAALYSTKTLNATFPAFTTLFLGNKSDIPAPLLSFLGSYRDYNLFAFDKIFIGIPQALGPISVDDFFHLPTGVVYQAKISRLLKKIDDGENNDNDARQSDLNIITLGRSSRRDFNTVVFKELDQADKEMFAWSTAVHLGNFDSHAQGLGYQNFHYLQPAVLETLPEDNIPKDIPSLDYILVHWLMRGSELGLPYRFNSKEIYTEIASQYTRKNRGDLTKIFDNQQIEKSRLMTFDNIHYTSEGSKLIAGAIVQHCTKIRSCGLN